MPGRVTPHAAYDHRPSLCNWIPVGKAKKLLETGGKRETLSCHVFAGIGKVFPGWVGATCPTVRVAAMRLGWTGPLLSPCQNMGSELSPAASKEGAFPGPSALDPGFASSFPKCESCLFRDQGRLTPSGGNPGSRLLEWAILFEYFREVAYGQVALLPNFENGKEFTS